jgi:hypothetical protein
MDPKKPSPESPEDRVNALSSRRGREDERRKAAADPATAPSDGAEDTATGDQEDPRERRPRLTERQRVEARRKRAEQRRRGRKPAPRGTRGTPTASGNALSRGVRATGTELRRTAIFLAGAIAEGLNRLGPVGRVVRTGTVELLRRIGRGLTALRRVLALGLARLGRIVRAADRRVTPRSATIAAAGFGTLALIVSQFLDFRATEIGQSGYQAVQEITRAPRRDLMTPIDAHSVLLLAVGLLCLAALTAFARSGRRRFGLIVAGCGLATIAVAVVIDLPQGLDVAEAEISYSEVAAVLLTGFWLQLAAGATLAATGLGLALTGSRSARAPSRKRRPARQRPGTTSGSPA